MSYKKLKMSIQWIDKRAEPEKVYMRKCRARITAECQNRGFIFRSRFRRTQICNECGNELKKLKTARGEFIKMTAEYEERIEWNQDKTKGKLKCIYKTPMMNGSEIAGSKQTDSEFEVSLEDLKFGLKGMEDTLNNQKKQLDEANKKLIKLGKKPVKTAEMIRFEQTLQKINTIWQIEATTKEIAPLEEDIKQTLVLINARKKTLGIE